MIAVLGKGFNQESSPQELEKYPDECPFCHWGISPRQWGEMFYEGARGQLTFICPRSDCHSLFIGYYQRGPDGKLRLTKVSKGNPQPATVFSQSIQDISASFVKIFHEAEIAERENLLEICGVGYRKAIEFLVKDYAIGKDVDKKSEIEKKFLGACINDYIDDPRIKSVASRATWLGNDETHYVRKWEGKNLGDLKALIRLTVHWLDMEAETKRFETEMPESGPAKGTGA